MNRVNFTHILDVRLVIHYTMPKTLEEFHQESGRAGRDGLLAYSILYYAFSDVRNLRMLIESKYRTFQ